VDAYGVINSGQVTNPSYILGGPDNDLAEIRGPNSGDGAYIVADYGTHLYGTLSVLGYSYNNGAGAYYSYIEVYTSPDDSTWTEVYNGFISPSGTNTPAWINVGTISSGSPIEYVKIVTVYAAGDSANFYIDAVSLG
jgi:hypothetical protein